MHNKVSEMLLLIVALTHYTKILLLIVALTHYTKMLLLIVALTLYTNNNVTIIVALTQYLHLGILFSLLALLLFLISLAILLLLDIPLLPSCLFGVTLLDDVLISYSSASKWVWLHKTGCGYSPYCCLQDRSPSCKYKMWLMTDNCCPLYRIVDKPPVTEPYPI